MQWTKLKAFEARKMWKSDGPSFVKVFLKGNYGKLPQNIDKIDAHTLIPKMFFGRVFVVFVLS